VALHFQDGDDAARRQQHSGAACHGEFERAGAFGSVPRRLMAPSRPAPAPVMPSLTSPTPIRAGNRSIARGRTASDSTTSVEIPARPQRCPSPRRSPAAISPARFRPCWLDRPARKLTTVQVPPTERLPDAIGGPVLRAAALKGDPSAAYEIGLRYAEGKRHRAQFRRGREMVRPCGASRPWCRRLQAGDPLRKGSEREKKTSISRGATTCRPPNAETPRRCIIWPCSTPTAAARAPTTGTRHNGFRKAADRGVADSQFNLGILYARGIGVEQNLAESFKCSASPRPRAMRTRCANATISQSGSIPSRSRRQSSPIQTFTPEPQPDDARQRGEPGGRMGRNAGAGRCAAKARSQADFAQANRRCALMQLAAFAVIYPIHKTV